MSACNNRPPWHSRISISWACSSNSTILGITKMFHASILLENPKNHITTFTVSSWNDYGCVSIKPASKTGSLRDIFLEYGCANAWEKWSTCKNMGIRAPAQPKCWSAETGNPNFWSKSSSIWMKCCWGPALPKILESRPQPPKNFLRVGSLSQIIHNTQFNTHSTIILTQRVHHTKQHAQQNITQTHSSVAPPRWKKWRVRATISMVFLF